MPTILLIDDDHHLLTIMTRILVKYDFEVVIARDGASGLQRARDLQPDLIILDIIMPGMDGFEVAKRLNDDPVIAHIPVMALTAQAMPYGRKMAAAAGVNEFMSKPFRIDELVARVESLTTTAGESSNGSMAT